MVTMKWLVASLGVLIFLILIPISTMNGTAGFIPELLIFSGITLLLAYFAEDIRLSVPVQTLVILGMIPHALGVFGFYGASPFPIQWDHVTHLAGLFGFALLFAGFLSQWMDARVWSRRNVMLFILIFFAASGVGALIELSEFVGYLKYGIGQGAFAFGPGDGFETFVGNTSDKIADIGGGWINTGWDLTFNTFGILLGIVAFIIRRAAIKKPDKAYYFEDVGQWSKKIN